jgi:hypothetical protein
MPGYKSSWVSASAAVSAAASRRRALPPRTLFEEEDDKKKKTSRLVDFLLGIQKENTVKVKSLWCDNKDAEAKAFLNSTFRFFEWKELASFVLFEVEDVQSGSEKLKELIEFSAGRKAIKEELHSALAHNLTYKVDFLKKFTPEMCAKLKDLEFTKTLCNVILSKNEVSHTLIDFLEGVGADWHHVITNRDGEKKTPTFLLHEEFQQATSESRKKELNEIKKYLNSKSERAKLTELCEDSAPQKKSRPVL